MLPGSKGAAATANEFVFRVVFAVLWAVFITNLSWVRYSASRRKEERPADQAARREWELHVTALAIFAPFWFGGIVLYIFIPDWIAFLSIPLPDWVRFIMAGMAAVSIPFTVWGYHTIGRNWVHAFEQSQFRQRTEDQLVTSGPYRYVRNPIYLGAFTMIIALAFLAANLLLLLPALFVVSLVYMQIDGEEAMLTERFGDEYREYAKRTPRIIPRFRRAASAKQRSETGPA